jgi:hypothetical protein
MRRDDILTLSFDEYSKYIPVKITEWEGNTCTRTFVNVLATSARETNAVQCCPTTTTTTTTTMGITQDEEFSSSSSSSSAFVACDSTNFLPFEKSLTDFPEAWVYPLFPWLYRFIWECLVPVNFATKHHPKHPRTSTTSSTMGALQRLGLYLMIMMIRGWILYLGMNALEQTVLSMPLLPTDDQSCWYKSMLSVNNNNSNSSSTSENISGTTSFDSCYGRMFDFSDHIVFYFVQYLAIITTEYVDALASCETGPTTPGFVVLTGLVLYLHVVVYAGVYKTSRWFHTGTEILVGWVLALVSVTLPLAAWQIHITTPCSSSSKDRRSV